MDINNKTYNQIAALTDEELEEYYKQRWGNATDYLNTPKSIKEELDRRSNGKQIRETIKIAKYALFISIFSAVVTIIASIPNFVQAWNILFGK